MFKLSLNLFTPKGFPIDELNHLALDRVKSISALWAPTGVKGLNNQHEYISSSKNLLYLRFENVNRFDSLIQGQNAECRLILAFEAAVSFSTAGEIFSFPSLDLLPHLFRPMKTTLQPKYSAEVRVLKYASVHCRLSLQGIRQIGIAIETVIGCFLIICTYSLIKN